MKIRIPAIAATVLLLAGPVPALADTGSDQFDAHVRQLQRQIAERNALDAEALRIAEARGYGVPYRLLAHTDGEAMDHAMALLSLNLQRHAMTQF